MLIVIPAVIASLAVAALVVWLVARGFADGDRPSDVVIGTRAVPGPAGGGWVAVEVANPSAEVAMVGLVVRRARHGAAAPGRRTGRRGARLDLADQILGTVEPGERETLHVWVEGDRRRLRLHAVVGTSGRLRRHVLAVPALRVTRGASAVRDEARLPLSGVS